jgi:hypothetical protein
MTVLWIILEWRVQGQVDDGSPAMVSHPASRKRIV